jgi:hypothetical protein
MHPRRAIAFAFALMATLATARAHAWQEAHEAGDDVDIHVGPDGIASVQHRLRWHVVHGPLRSIDLLDFEVPAASVDPNVEVTAEDGHKLTAHVTTVQERRDGKRDENRDPARDERTIRIEVDEPRSFLRGTFTFEVHYRVDWVASRALAVDGPAWRLTWSGPIAADGFDSSRVTFELPAAPGEPRAILADTGAPDESVVSSLRRDPTQDTLELVRPHVAKGDSIVWTVRLDPRALHAVVDPRLRPPARAKLPEEPNRIFDASLAGMLAALGLGFAWLVLQKTRAFAAQCAANGGGAVGLIPLPALGRAALAGAALAAGVASQVLDPGDGYAIGAALVALSALAAAVRPVAGARAPRGPGRWLVLRPDDAFAGPWHAGHWLDVDARAGRLGAATATGVVVALVAVTALVARAVDPHLPWLAALDATALAPLFLTGRGSSLAPERAHRGAPWLAKVFARLRPDGALRVAPWIRSVSRGDVAPQSDPPRVEGDELRLLVLPRAATPGLVGIEVGLAWSATPVGWAGSPEVLVRVLERSAAASRLGTAIPSARTTFGRHADERVASLRPHATTAAGTTALVRELAEALRDRRQEPKVHEHPDRRTAAPVALARGEGSPRPARSPPGVGAARSASASPPTPSC